MSALYSTGFVIIEKNGDDISNLVKAKVHGSEVNIVSAPFYDLNSFSDSLFSKGYAHVKNALTDEEVNIILNSKMYKSFNVEQTLANQDVIDCNDVYIMPEDGTNFYEKIKQFQFIQKLKTLFKEFYIDKNLGFRIKKNSIGMVPHLDSYSKNYFNHLDHVQFFTIWFSLQDINIYNSVFCIAENNTKITSDFTAKFRTCTFNQEEQKKYDSITVRKRLYGLKLIANEISDTWIANNFNKGDAVIFNGDVIHCSTDCVSGSRNSFDLRVTDTVIPDMIYVPVP